MREQQIETNLRGKYGSLKLGRTQKLDNDTILDMYEYVYRVNVGISMTVMMNALAVYEPDEDLDNELNEKTALEQNDQGAPSDEE